MKRIGRTVLYRLRAAKYQDVNQFWKGSGVLPCCRARKFILTACILFVGSGLVPVRAEPVGVAPAPPRGTDILVPKSVPGGERSAQVTFEIPAAGAFACPKLGTPTFLKLSDVSVSGGLPALKEYEAKLIVKVKGHELSYDQICGELRKLEEEYARRGYIFVRVSVPPQVIGSGSVLRVNIVNGFIENITTSGVNRHIAKATDATVSRLRNRPGLTLSQVDRVVSLAGALPGARLGSTLIAGKLLGGVQLIMTGAYSPVSGSLSVDNRLPSGLGVYKSNATLVLNGLLGLREKAYASASSALGGDQFRFFSLPFRFYGIGLALPIGYDGLSVNTEYSHSDSAAPAIASYPAYSAVFDRQSVKIEYPLILNHESTVFVSADVENVRSVLTATAFGSELSNDHFWLVRINGNASGHIGRNVAYRVEGGFTQGIGGRRPDTTATSFVPISRQGTSPFFRKVSLDANLRASLGKSWQLDILTQSQFTFGKPVYSSEQISLEGTGGISGISPGTLTIDSGGTARAELSTGLLKGTKSSQLRPYAFAAVGGGELGQPTAVEHKSVFAAAFGAGVRVEIPLVNDRVRLALAVDYGRAFSDLPATNDRRTDRVNGQASLAF